MEARNRGVEAQKWSRGGYVDLHHFDEDSDPHQSKKSDPDQHQNEKRDLDPEHSVSGPRH